MQKIKQLERLASELVGDGGAPNLFFVTVDGIAVTVTQNFDVAYHQWKTLKMSNEVAMVEDRQHGCVCQTRVECENPDTGKKFMTTVDDSRLFNLARQ